MRRHFARKALINARRADPTTPFSQSLAAAESKLSWRC